MNARTALLLASAGLAAAVMLGSQAAEAGKKPSPPPPPPPVPGGKIYFVNGSSVAAQWTMNPDGSGKTALPVGVPNAAGDSQNAHPSYLLHAGHRWFLGSRRIPGEYFPGGLIQRRTIVAVRADGAVVTDLVAQADLLVATAYTRWSRDDSMISLVAARYVDGVRGPYGIYTASLEFGTDGNVTGVAAQPVAPSVPLSSASVIDTDWSPDGARIVAAVDGSLWIADLTTGGVTPLPTSVTAGLPSWSPDGTRIAFSGMSASGWKTVRTIGVAGTGETTIATGTPNVVNATWSPDGSYLVYQAGNLFPDVYRVPAVGGTPVNLTGDVGVWTSPWGWR